MDMLTTIIYIRSSFLQRTTLHRHHHRQIDVVVIITHTAHHRGQAEVYLRVKGIKPPAYTF